MRTTSWTICVCARARVCEGGERARVHERGFCGYCASRGVEVHLPDLSVCWIEDLVRRHAGRDRLAFVHVSRLVMTSTLT